MFKWIIATSFCCLLLSCSITKEHKEARNVTIENIDFPSLADGTYTGYYEGGMYKWRECEVEVTVSLGKVKEIKLLNSKDPGGNNADHDKLFNRVINEQSLQVDALSGATLTSKAYLKAIEIALLKSLNNQ